MTGSKVIPRTSFLARGAAWALIPVLMTGCQTDTGTGALAGGSGGTLIGALLDHGNPLAGALVGAAGGALVGGLVGHHMDQAKQDLEKQLAPEVNAGQITMQMLPGNAVQIEMTSMTAFPRGLSLMNTAFIPTLQKIGSIARTYGKMTITVIGYPDAGGLAQQESVLAYQRAEAVRSQLIALGVPPVLLVATGGPSAPADDGHVRIILTPVTVQ